MVCFVCRYHIILSLSVYIKIKIVLSFEKNEKLQPFANCLALLADILFVMTKWT